MNPIFHIVDRDVWTAAVERGEYRPASLAAEGFVHFSFADQVRDTHDRYYHDVPNLFVVEVDPARLATDVKIENEFPHVYGPIPSVAAVGIYELDEFSAAGLSPTDR